MKLRLRLGPLPLATIVWAALAFPGWVQAQPQGFGELWQGVDQPPQDRQEAEKWIKPDIFRLLRLRHTVLADILARAPRESTRFAGRSEAEIPLPLPGGGWGRFRFVESPVMASELGAKFPELKTYLGQGVDDPLATVRFDLTPVGFHAQVLSPNGAVYIEPQYRGDTNLYACYYKRDYRRPATDFQCFTPNGETVSLRNALAVPNTVSGGSLRTYRLAVAATAEYTQYFGTPATVAAGMAAIVTAINRVTGVYETEVGIRLVLVANNDLLVYTNVSTEPYSNGNPAALLSQNQSNLDYLIGSANYDIGHVFSTAGGGLAAVGVACVAGIKAEGETGTYAPVGDAFYIDYVAHEIGHQFGAHHPFNSTMAYCGTGYYAPTAYEPGSGSTIMAYAGLCGSDNLQMNSDPYFHSVSLDEIITYSTTGAGSSCPTVSATGDNPPTVNAGAGFTIPKGTPFTLTASGSDPDGDQLTYCWEERDLGPSTTLSSPDNGSSPLFRSFSPTTGPARTFPQWSDVLNNTATPGEMLPTTNRTMTFRVTARDNRAGGGGLSTSDTQVAVTTSAGPFVVTAPAAAVTWAGTQTITWNVAGTAGAPVNATNVNILLSTNGGLAFPLVLASNVPNVGAQTLLLPSLSSSSCRVCVQSVGNVFFNVSPGNFTIMPPAPKLVLDSTALVAEDCGAGNGAIDPGELVTVNFVLKNTGTADTTNLTATLLATNGVTPVSGPQVYGALPAGGSAINRSFTFLAGGTCGGTITPWLQLQDGAVNRGIVAQRFALGVVATATNSFTNATPIDIPASGTQGKASPYPSSISVSNVSGTLSRLAVTLNGLTHARPSDINVLLVGPGGQNVLLMSHAGTNQGITNITLTLDDAASLSLPFAAIITNGTYKPTQYGAAPAFSSPAPAAPYGTNLSTFYGLNPAGTWSLYAYDDANNRTGSVTQGWTLVITTTNAVCCTGPYTVADLVLSSVVAPPVVNVGGNLTWTLVVTNAGPSTANGVTVTNPLAAGEAFVGATTTQGTATNSNGVVAFAVGSLPSGASATLTITVTALAGGILTNSAVVAASTADPNLNNNAASAAASVNTFPVISPIVDQATNEDSTIGPIPFTIGDAETPAGALTVSGASSNTNLVPDTNIVFGGGNSNRTVIITPLPLHYGATVITVTVSDGLAATSQPFMLTVNRVNHAPMLAPIPNYTLDEQTTLTFTNLASDVDTPPDVLTFSLTNGPAGASVKPTNGVFTWAPAEDQGPSTNVLTVTVTDNGSPNLSASQTFTVVVNEVNRAPVLPLQTDRTITGLGLLVVTNVATDPDIPTNTLTYTLVAAPTNALIDTNGVITWSPAAAQVPGTNVFETVVTDFNPWAVNAQQLSATNSFMVVVDAIHNGPVLPPQDDRTVDELTLLVVTNGASDGDIPAFPLTYQLVDPPAGASIDTNGIITWMPSEEQGPGTNVLETVVSDEGEPPLSATNSFTVVVNEVNSAPVLPLQTNWTIAGLATLVVTNTASDADIPANTLTYTLVAAPTNAVIDTNGVITWSPVAAQVPGTNVFETVVTDFNPWAVNAQQLSATNSFMVVVDAIHNGPVLPPQADQTVNELTLLVVTNRASDGDIPALPLTYQLVDPPAGASIDTNGIITWTPGDEQAPGTNLIETVVSDEGEPPLSATNRFIVVVADISPTPPTLPPIGDQTILAGELLAVSNSITSQAEGNEVLGFSLAMDAPAGASVNPTSGAFSWTPDAGQGPSTNLITILVTDTEVPGWIGRQTFTVLVLVRPAFESIQRSNDVVSITWHAIPGQVYRVQYQSEAADGNWSNLGPDVTADGPTQVTTDPASAATHRFYRVQLLP